MIVLARFDSAPDLILDVASDDAGADEDALFAMVVATLAQHDVTDEPIELYPIPRGVFAAEVHYSDETDSAAGAVVPDLSPANLTEAGIALEPLDRMTEWIDQVPEDESDAATDEDDADEDT